MHHAEIIIRNRLAPTGQERRRRQRRRLAKGIIHPHDRWSVSHVRAEVDSLLAGEESLLPGKPSAVYVRMRRVEFLAPQTANLARRQSEDAQQVSQRVATDREIRREALRHEEPGGRRRVLDRLVGSLARRRWRAEQGRHIDVRYAGIPRHIGVENNIAARRGWYSLRLWQSELMGPDVDPVETDDSFPAAASVVVIGGGIIGASAALTLAAGGISVALCEKGHVACEQSSRNWGWCRQAGRDAREMPLIVESLRLWRDMDRLTGSCDGLSPVRGDVRRRIARG